MQMQDNTCTSTNISTGMYSQQRVCNSRKSFASKVCNMRVPVQCID